jgi:hypothetical protein
VDDEPDVGAIDPHAEGDRRDDDVHALAEEGVLVAAAFRLGQTGVIGERRRAFRRQPCGERVHFLP